MNCRIQNYKPDDLPKLIHRFPGSFSLKDLLILFYVPHVQPGVCRDQKMAPDPLEMESRVAMSGHLGAVS